MLAGEVLHTPHSSSGKTNVTLMSCSSNSGEEIKAVGRDQPLLQNVTEKFRALCTEGQWSTGMVWGHSKFYICVLGVAGCISEK